MRPPCLFIFYALVVINDNKLDFSPALMLVLTIFFKIESDSDGGLLSILFALIGAGITMYGTRKPAFKARFIPLETPAATMSSVAAN